MMASEVDLFTGKYDISEWEIVVESMPIPYGHKRGENTPKLGVNIGVFLHLEKVHFTCAI